MEIKASGLAAENLDSGKSGYANVIQSDTVLGIAPEFTYTEGLNVEDVVLNFKVKDGYTANTNGKYADVSDDFNGIKRFNVFKYFDDIDMLLPIETTYDMSNNTVSTHVDELGTYCLLDMETWFEMLEVDPGEFETVTVSASPVGMLGVSLPKPVVAAVGTSADVSKKNISQDIDVVFFNFTSNMTQAEHLKDNIRICAKELFKKYGEGHRVHIYISNSTDACFSDSLTGEDYCIDNTSLERILTNVKDTYVPVRNQGLEKTSTSFFKKNTLRENSDRYFFFNEYYIPETTEKYISNVAYRLSVKEKGYACVIASRDEHKILHQEADGKYFSRLTSYGLELAKFIFEKHGVNFKVISPINF